MKWTENLPIHHILFFKKSE